MCFIETMSCFVSFDTLYSTDEQIMWMRLGKNNKSKQQKCTFAGVGFYWSTLTVQFECQCASSPGWDVEAVGLWIWFWAAEFGPQTAWRDHELWGWQRQGIQCVSFCNTEATTQVQPNLTCVASLKLHDVAGWREIASEVLKMHSICSVQWCVWHLRTACVSVLLVMIYTGFIKFSFMNWIIFFQKASCAHKCNLRSSPGVKLGHLGFHSYLYFVYGHKVAYNDPSTRKHRFTNYRL